MSKEVICYCPVCGHKAKVNNKQGSGLLVDTLYYTEIFCEAELVKEQDDKMCLKVMSRHTVAVMGCGVTKSVATKRALNEWNKAYNYSKIPSVIITRKGWKGHE